MPMSHKEHPSCPRCKTNKAQSRGTDSKGRKRFLCKSCRRSFTVVPPKALGTMRLPDEKVIQVLRMLLEGMSIRSCERLTGVHRHTICKMVAMIGPKCEAFLQEHVQIHPFTDIQIDEQWSFVYAKEKTAKRLGLGPFVGDCYVFIGFDRDTKFVVGFSFGRRDNETTNSFLSQVRPRISGWPRISTDGFGPYERAVPAAFDGQCDFGTIVKIYGTPTSNDAQTRYSPAQIIRTEKTIVCGTPDRSKITTSHVERMNLNNRMQVRRMTRLTNGFSKKWENHQAMLSLWFLYYNYCRPHMGFEEPGKRVPPTTPAMKAGIADHVWGIEELLTAVA